MPIIGAMAENATLFVIYNRTQTLIRSMSAPSPSHSPGEPLAPMSLPQLAAAAGCAGAVASFILTPIELVKCRMQVQLMARGLASTSTAPLPLHHMASSPVARPHAPVSISPSSSASSPHFSTSARPSPSPSPPPGPVGIVAATLRTHGISGLWLGQTGTLLRETGGSTAWFVAFEAVTRVFIKRRQTTAPDGVRVTKSDLAAWQLMAAGACAGISYNFILYPADSIKSTIQTAEEIGGGDPKSIKARGFFQVGRDIYRSRGIKGLYSGCGLTCMRSAPSSAMIFLIYS
jgi:mitochondrial ornithine carrier protein